jgi:hypothetical protein
MSYHGSHFLTDRVLIEAGEDIHWYLPCIFVKLARSGKSNTCKYSTYQRHSHSLDPGNQIVYCPTFA